MIAGGIRAVETALHILSRKGQSSDEASQRSLFPEVR